MRNAVKIASMAEGDLLLAERPGSSLPFGGLGSMVVLDDHELSERDRYASIGRAFMERVDQIHYDGVLTLNFDDVGAFHERFDLPRSGEPSPPHLLSKDVYEYRREFLREELEEFEQAVERGDLPEAFDALLDLAYVVFGTAHLMHLPWQAGWAEVQRANMAKVRAESAEESAEKTGRGHAYDVVKPEGWEPPRIREVLLNHGWEGA